MSDTEHAQSCFGLLIDRGLVDAARVVQPEPQEADDAVSDRTQRDLGVRNIEASRRRRSGTGRTQAASTALSTCGNAGLGGIGKTSLAAWVAQTVAASFEQLYRRSLRNAPTVNDWLAGVIGSCPTSRLVSRQMEQANYR